MRKCCQPAVLEHLDAAAIAVPSLCYQFRKQWAIYFINYSPYVRSALALPCCCLPIGSQFCVHRGQPLHNRFSIADNLKQMRETLTHTCRPCLQLPCTSASLHVLIHCKACAQSNSSSVFKAHGFSARACPMPDKGAISGDGALASHLQHELQLPVFFLRWGKHRQRKESTRCTAMFSASFKSAASPLQQFLLRRDTRFLVCPC